MSDPQRLLSLVLPSHDEEDNVRVIHQAVSTVLAGYAFEMIYVDDGSRDGTAAAVQALMADDARVRLIRLTRNFGHQAALLAGLEAARGAAVIVMDCDMQHPPACLPEMIRTWEAGFPVVRMVRKRTIGIGRGKRLFSDLFHSFINRLADVNLTRGVADFALLDRMVVTELLPLTKANPFLRGMISWLGHRTAYLEYVAEARNAGQPSYNFRRSFALALSATLSMSRRPLRAGIYLGCGMALLCLLYALYVVFAFVSGRTVPGWASLMLMFLGVSSVQFFILGIIGEYLGITYDRIRNLPNFVAYPENSPASRTSEGGQPDAPLPAPDSGHSGDRA